MDTSNDLDSVAPTLSIARYGEKTLCDSCQRLDLSIEKFIIESPGISQQGQSQQGLSQHGSRRSASSASNIPSNLENIATGESTSALPGNSKTRLNSGNTRIVLATIGHVQNNRETCSFCNLTYDAIERYSGNKIDESIKIFLSWEVDGRQILKNDRVINRTRRIRMTWRDNTDKEETIHMVFVAPSGSRRPNSDAGAGLAKSTHFLGRGLASNTEKKALIRSWIDLCVDKHGENCRNKHGTSDEFERLIRGTYFGVLDVIDMQLKELPIVDGRPERYVALSYVWGHRPGASKPYVTTRSNVMLHIQHGGLEKAWDKLPRTIQDVILLVSRLGERYVWIDSLCIVQDSASSWELNAKAMHLVYGNAHFTICAADGDAGTGLLAMEGTLPRTERAPENHHHHHQRRSVDSQDYTPPRSSASHPSRQRERSSSPHLSDSLKSGSSTSNKPAPYVTTIGLGHTDEPYLPPLTSEVLPGIRLLVSRPTEAVIQESRWNQRGWTFQERLLSRRCLIFAEGQVYFQCRSSVISQHIFSNGGANGWSLDWTNSPLRTLGELRRRAFWFYMKCVNLYTGRTLTKPKDVLTAFQGVSWLLEQQLNAPLFYGLPMSHFDLALLWVPVPGSDHRRRHKSDTHDLTPGCSQDAQGNCTCKVEEEGYGSQDFPSWSWCGWQGAKSVYKLDMLDGCLTNVQEWLREHSWIQWYVRDYEGDLRPLWDRDVLLEDGSAEARWRGYAGLRAERHKSTSSRTSRKGTDSDAGMSIGTRTRGLTTSDLRNTDSDRFPYGSPRGPGDTVSDSRSGYTQPRRTSSPPLRPGHDRRDSSDRRLWSRQSNVAYLDRLQEGYYDYTDDAPQASRPRRGFRPSSNYHDPYAPPLGPSPGPPVRPPPGIFPVPPYPRQSWAGEEESQYRNSQPSVAQNRADDYLAPRYRELRRSGDRYGSVDADVGLGDSTRDNPDHKEELSSAHGSTTARRAGPSDYGSGDEGDAEDAYGRTHPQSNAGHSPMEFTGILPDNPFGIIRGPFPEDRKDHARAMPILQFWTWRTELLVTIRPQLPSANDTSSSSRRDSGVVSHPSSELVQCDIVDKPGDWCGSMSLPSDLVSTIEGMPVLFIALSDAKAFTSEECPVWNYYIPKERDESEWDLYHVMLLQRNLERALWERVAVVKVFQAAFGDAVWDEIKLG